MSPSLFPLITHYTHKKSDISASTSTHILVRFDFSSGIKENDDFSLSRVPRLVSISAHCGACWGERGAAAAAAVDASKEDEDVLAIWKWLKKLEIYLEAISVA